MDGESLFERASAEERNWCWAETPPKRAVRVRARQRILDQRVVIAGQPTLAALVSRAGAARVVDYLRYGTEIDRASCTVDGQPLAITGDKTLVVVMKHPSGSACRVLDETAVRVCLDAPACYARVFMVNVVPVVCGNARYLRPGALLEEAATYGLGHFVQVSQTGEKTVVSQPLLARCDAHNPQMVEQTTGVHAVPGLRNAAFIRQILLQRLDADVLLATGALRCSIETGEHALGQAYCRLLETLAPLADLNRLFVLGLCADHQYGRSPRPQNPRDAVPLVDGAWVLHPVALARLGRRRVLTLR
ncbi:hypothetical protein [Lacticaseibacillus kribbianus]|uniref:hypothetical protein n=1 Tax=Lacticaseibacillus kribbianus TaxID=2926292 RepID=UPI001CD6443C|nr:hypothetical protein [Lacticaseibacillus kribbianus]